MVTVFLIATALLNIGVGYWLAVYLQRARRSVESDLPDDHAVATLGDLNLPAAAQVAAPPAVPGAPAPSATAPAAEEQLEQDVLAGIEEFRNQLAQLKSHGENELQPTPSPPLAAAAPA